MILLLLGALVLATASVVRAESPTLTKDEMAMQLAAIKRNARSKDPIVRTTAARDLVLLTGEDAGELALDLLADDSAPVRFAAIHSLSQWQDESSLEWLCDKGLRKGSPAAQASLLRALGLGNAPDFVRDAVTAKLRSNREEVQAAAIEALGTLGARDQMETIAGLAGDSAMEIREAVAVALGDIGSSANMDIARQLIADEEWEVRAAMISSAARLEIKPMVSLLVSRLAVEPERRLRADLHDGLVQLTGQDFGRDPDLWISWWNANKDEFGQTEKIEIRVEKSDYGETTEYYGIRLDTSRVLFVIDVSESMNKGGGHIEVVQPDGQTRAIDKPDNMSIARAELERVVSTLDDTVRFNIMTYAENTELYKPGCVWATAGNKSAAIKWVRKLKPHGLSTTDTYLALMTALGAAGKSIAAAARSRPVYDSVFFLADGQPTTGITTDPEEILRDVRQANPDARIVIHTILIPTEGEIAGQFMSSLAAENGGDSVTLGR